MIQNTFLHLHGVGNQTEERPWNAGYDGWDRLRHALKSANSSGDLFHNRLQGRLFPDEDHSSVAETAGMPSHDNRAFLRIDELEQSRQALANCSYSFFLDRLRPSFHWRLLPHILKDALYLDIESTGLSRHHHYVTVIGALYGIESYSPFRSDFETGCFIGARGFEPPTPWSRTRCSSQAEPRPEEKPNHSSMT